MRAFQRYGHMVVAAITDDRPDVAREAYLLAEALPSLTTVQQFRVNGYLIDGPIFEGSVLTYCFKDDLVYVLKPLDETELVNVQRLRERLGNATIPGITSFEIHETEKKRFMIMPKYEYALETLEFISAAGTVRFWQQMHAALSALHSLGLAHNDVKPGNICATAASFVLVDLGSVQEFGQPPKSTPAYIPHDLRGCRSSKQLDWWMLAMTMAEKCCAEHGMRVGAGARSATRAEIRVHLERYLPAAVWASVCAVLDSADAQH